MNGKLKFRYIFIIACMLFFNACASGTPQEDPGVQDIKPGETSVIQPPSSQPVETARPIEERNI